MGETYERRDMAGSVFRDVNLGGATFERVNLAGATFDNVSLADVTIPDATLEGLFVRDANIAGLTIFGIRVDELIEAELDRRDPERASLRMRDIHDPEAIREVMARLDKVREKFREWLRSKDAGLLATRPAPEAWSAIDCVRHLVSSEDGYLNRRILRNDKPLCRLGLLPAHAIADPQYAEVGTEPTNDLETVLAAWERIHTATWEYLNGVTAEELRRETDYTELVVTTVGGVLQVLARHDLVHIRQAEAALAVLEQEG